MNRFEDHITPRYLVSVSSLFYNASTKGDKDWIKTVKSFSGFGGEVLSGTVRSVKS